MVHALVKVTMTIRSRRMSQMVVLRGASGGEIKLRPIRTRDDLGSGMKENEEGPETELITVSMINLDLVTKGRILAEKLARHFESNGRVPWPFLFDDFSAIQLYTLA